MKLRLYPELYGDVRNDGLYYPIRSLVQPEDPEVREIAKVLQKAPDFIDVAHQFVHNFTKYATEQGDFWATPQEMLAARSGDCVTGDTPIWVRIAGNPKIVEVTELIDADYAQLVGVDILTPSGFSPLLSITRKESGNTVRFRTTSDVEFSLAHRLVAKPMFHNPDRYCEAGNISAYQLTKTFPKLEYSRVPYSTNISDHDLGWALGLFFADGTVSIRRNSTQGGESWRLVNYKIENLERAASAFEKLYPEIVFKINKFDSYKEGEIVDSTIFKGPRGKTLYCLDALLKYHDYKGRRAAFARRFQRVVYNSLGHKKVPDFVLTGSHGLANGFWNGAHAGDGGQQDNCITCKNKIGTLGLAFLLRRLGYIPNVNQSHNASSIRPSISEKEYRSWRSFCENQELFDLATATGEFVAGDINSKNCDDSAILLASLLRTVMPPEKVFVAIGEWSRRGDSGGHAWVIVPNEDGTDRILESTSSPNLKPYGNYKLEAMFNDMYAFATGEGLTDFDLIPGR